MQFCVYILLIALCIPVLALAQPSQNCEERLTVLQEDYAILQDQHAMITIPRAESDQRALIKLRRDLERAQHRIKVLEAERSVQRQESGSVK